MKNLFNLSSEEKKRIRGLHLVESQDNRITSVLSEQYKKWDIKNIKRTCLTVQFESGKADITAAWELNPPSGADSAIQWTKIIMLIRAGMKGDRPFIDIEAGTSGTGSHKRNRQVMDERINDALDLVLEEIIDWERGSNNLSYSVPSILAKTNIDRNYSTIEPGSILPSGEEVPTDPNHPYFKDSQYVNICFNPVIDTPGYGSLADKFMAATIEKIGRTDEDTVYSILNELRDGDDFVEFNEELKRDYGMDFYEVACDSTMWIEELGGGDTTINAHLRRLGARPIAC